MSAAVEPLEEEDKPKKGPAGSGQQRIYTPASVLQEKMEFYHNKAEVICLKIIEVLKTHNPTRGDLLAMMYKNMQSCNDIAIDCAAKLAPYKHPKLESVEMKKSVTHRFVVRSPNVIPNKDDWLNSIGPIEEPKLIELQSYNKDKVQEEYLEESE